MVRFTVDNRNRLIFYGNPVGYVKDDTAVVDEMFRTDELNQYLRRMNLMPRWEDGIFDRLVSGEVTGEELTQSRKGCRIWQLKKDVDVAMRFIGYEDQVRKFGEPDAGNYTLVFDGDLGTSDLEQIYTIITTGCSAITTTTGPLMKSAYCSGSRSYKLSETGQSREKHGSVTVLFSALSFKSGVVCRKD